MPSLPPTFKRSIELNLQKIEDSSFLESDIKMLLIDIRELLPLKSFTRELAHFIAHPKRDRGICYEELNTRALIVKQVHKDYRIFPAPVHFLSLKKDVFNILLNNTLRRYYASRKSQSKPAGSFIHDYPREADLRKLIEGLYHYNRDINNYILKELQNLPFVANIFGEILAILNANPVINASDMIKQINNDVKSIVRKYFTTRKYENSIINKGDEVTLCIFTLFQDVQFDIVDGTSGRFQLDAQSSPPEHTDDPVVLAERAADFSLPIEEYTLKLIKKSPLFLSGIFELTPHVDISSAFIASELLASDYISDEIIIDYNNRNKTRREQSPPGKPCALLESFHLERDIDKKLFIVKN